MWPRPRADHAGHDGAGDVEQTLDVGVDHLVPVLTLAFVQLCRGRG